MRKNMKRLFKGVIVSGVLFALVGCGVLLGLAIGLSEGQSRRTVVVQNEVPYRLREEVVIGADERMHEEIAREFAEEVEGIAISPLPTLPPIPTLPPVPTLPAVPTLPPIPPMPDIPARVYIDHGPSFFDVVNGIGTILASFGLIGLGIVMVARGRRAPKEKTPESLMK